MVIKLMIKIDDKIDDKIDGNKIDEKFDGDKIDDKIINKIIDKIGNKIGDKISNKLINKIDDKYDIEYTCKCCNYTTSIKCCINKHYSSKKHIDKFKKNNYCDICKKEYNNNWNFRRHYLSSHKDEYINCNILHNK